MQCPNCIFANDLRVGFLFLSSAHESGDCGILSSAEWEVTLENSKVKNKKNPALVSCRS